VEHQRDELGLACGRLGWLGPNCEGEIHSRQASTITGVVVGNRTIRTLRAGVLSSMGA
jgi:hypothetical protein